MRPVKLRKGDRLWVRDRDLVWREAVLLGRDKHENDPDKLLVQLGTEDDLGSRKSPRSNKQKLPTKTVSARTDCEVRLVATASELAAVEDLTQVPALHEPSLLATLHSRFEQDQIYTKSGRVLLAVNPYKHIKGLYGRSVINQYFSVGAATEGLPPHLYGVASAAYVKVLDEGGVNQTVLVSGESGSGKTESTKILLRAITEMTELRLGSPKQTRGRAGAPALSDRVLQANPILEAFGNASTLRNENSSRFGKLIQIALRPVQGTLDGGYITTYLLEKARLAHQSPGERNFHIFYAMSAGGSPTDLASWRLTESDRGVAAFSYISDKDAVYDDIEADRKRLDAIKNAMKVLGFTPSDIKAVFEVVAGVLHLGNIEFAANNRGEASRVAPKGPSMLSCAACCDLLHIDADALERALCKRVIRVNGSRPGGALPSFAQRQDEAFEKANSVEEAARARDALAMTLYERLFAWLVWRINQALRDGHAATPNGTSPNGSIASNASTASTSLVSPISVASSGFGSGSRQNPRRGLGPSARPSRNAAADGGSADPDAPILRHGHEIGILDVFGFEVFPENGFEQLCINYCNERLQSLFNEYVFLRDQEEYNAEGINWEYVNFPANNSCLEMIESRPIGLLALIDENCLVPHGNDDSLINKIYAHLPKQYETYLPPSQYDRGNMRFTIRHFAGKVLYSAAGFTRKNKNELRQEAVDLVRSSRHAIVRILCPEQAADAAGGADLASYFDHELGANGHGPAGSGAGGKNGILRNGLGGKALRSRPSQQGVVQQKTVLGHFKAQLDAALQSIRASETHFVRCLKPNDVDEPHYMDRTRMVEQLRYSGVLQMVQVARGGYLTRMTYEDFLVRFATLIPLVVADLPTGGYFGTPIRALSLCKRGTRTTLQRYCKDILRCFGLVYGDDFQTGKTKVFLRQHSFTLLELAKDAARGRAARMIQRAFRVHVEYQLKREAATIIQCMYRQRAARELRRTIGERREYAAQTIQIAVLQYLNNLRRHRRRQARQERSKQQKKAKALGLVCSPVATRVTFDLANVEVRQIESRHDDKPYTAPTVIIPNQAGILPESARKGHDRKLGSPPPPHAGEDLGFGANDDDIEDETDLEFEDAGLANGHDADRKDKKKKKTKKDKAKKDKGAKSVANGEPRGRPKPATIDGETRGRPASGNEVERGNGANTGREPADSEPVLEDEMHEDGRKTRGKKSGRTQNQGGNDDKDDLAEDAGIADKRRKKKKSKGGAKTEESEEGADKKAAGEADEDGAIKRAFRKEGIDEIRKALAEAGFTSAETLKDTTHADLRRLGITVFATREKALKVIEGLEVTKSDKLLPRKPASERGSKADDKATVREPREPLDGDVDVDEDDEDDEDDDDATRRGTGVGRKLMTAFAMFVVLIPIVFALGGFDSGLSYATAAVMTAWIWFHVFFRGASEAEDDEDDDDESDEDDGGSSISSDDETPASRQAKSAKQAEAPESKGSKKQKRMKDRRKKKD